MTVLQELTILNAQLYPTGRAWRFVRGNIESQGLEVEFVDGEDDKFVDGVSDEFVSISFENEGSGRRINDAFLKVDEILYNDIASLFNIILPDSSEFDETDASNWERVYGINNSSLALTERKQIIQARIAYPNGIPERQHYTFIEEQLQAAGFNVFVTENRFINPSFDFEPVDPDLIASQPYQYGNAEYGIAEYGGTVSGNDYTVCANYVDESLDSTFFDPIINSSEYGVSEYGVTQYGVPAQMTREEKLRFTFFVGGSGYPNRASVPLSRKDEFRHLILKLKPAHSVAFLYIDYV